MADAVATVTFQRPGKRNALTSQMRADLPGLLDSLQADPDVRVVVLTGAGDKAFTSGADISEFGERRTSPAARADYAAGAAGSVRLSLAAPPSSAAPPAARIRAGLPVDSIICLNTFVKQERRSGWGT